MIGTLKQAVPCLRAGSKGRRRVAVGAVPGKEGEAAQLRLVATVGAVGERGAVGQGSCARPCAWLRASAPVCRACAAQLGKGIRASLWTRLREGRELVLVIAGSRQCQETRRLR